MHRRLVLLGPPAAGKGTQAELLKNRFGFDAPSVGGMLREQKAAGTPAGLRAGEYFERGLLVPDEITIEIVRGWLAAAPPAWVLDGYPRTVRQAEAFDAMLQAQGLILGCAILLEVGEPVIRDRVAHRLGCAQCGAVLRLGLHVHPGAETCPRCGGPLTRRKDDTPEALADRLSEYRAKTAPVIAYYEQRAILSRIDGERTPDAVFADVAAILQAPVPPPALPR